MKTIKVATDFYPRLANRNDHQGDGKHNAIEFRSKYLKDLELEKSWKDKDAYIEFDFSGVTKIGPSFANEAFAFFTKFVESAEIIKRKIKFKNISHVQQLIIDEEIESGYRTK